MGMFVIARRRLQRLENSFELSVFALQQ